jgi:phenylpyruvate tautomerase PptA (4-oxalocrotonate tautomerase family)
MTKVAIIPVKIAQGRTSYHAIANGKRSAGATAGAALDALAVQLPTDETNTLVIVQHFRPDAWFTASQQQRLDELFARWRAARDHDVTLDPYEQAELESLIEAELEAATRRSAALADSADL